MTRSTASGASAPPVIAVGSRVFVHCIEDASGSVILTDESGTVARSSLADGVVVEVLAWRPRGSGGTRYRVRVGREGADGWVAAANLRTTAARPAVAPPAPTPEPKSQPDMDGRRFGQRAWTR
jgi:hypothetical protein